MATNNEPAFPSGLMTLGMTLRDYFAAKAMAAAEAANGVSLPAQEQEGK